MTDLNSRNVLFVLNHDLRRRALKLMIEATGKNRYLSADDVARTLRLPLSNVGYHVRVMAQRGVIEVAETRSARGMTQRFYRPAAELAKMTWVKSLVDIDNE